MNELEKLFAVKKTENGDVAYKTTDDNLTDLFFMTPYFEKHLDHHVFCNTVGSLPIPMINVFKQKLSHSSLTSAFIQIYLMMMQAHSVGVAVHHHGSVSVNKSLLCYHEIDFAGKGG